MICLPLYTIVRRLSVIKYNIADFSLMQRYQIMRLPWPHCIPVLTNIKIYAIIKSDIRLSDILKVGNEMIREEVRAYVNQYCKLRDIQYAAYELYARKHNLTAKELFVLDIIWFTEDGCLQSEICERLSATKQTVSAIIKKFWKLGYISLTEAETDRRNKIVRFTETGKEYAKHIIPPAASAEIDAMAELTEKDMIELVRITTIFSNYMKEKFNEIKEN